MNKNQKDRIEKVKKLLEKQRIRSMAQLEDYKLSVCHPLSAGIDIGSREIYVAINPEIAAELDQPIVRSFNTYTQGLEQCAQWLEFCGIRDVSMESTSVYWKNLYDVLERNGMEVCLVNPKKFRMVPGRKTDVLDCQWLQTLHLYGLLSGSFIPQEHIRRLRSFMRQRDTLLKDRSRYVLRMQKALVEMNLMLVNVVGDIMGKTGTAIIEAILNGERDAKTLASLRDRRCAKSEEEIALALTGDYKSEQLYLLKTNYASFRFFSSQIDDLDKEIEKLLAAFPLARKSHQTDKPQADNRNETAATDAKDKKDDKGEKKKRRTPRPSKNDLHTDIDLHQKLIEIAGVDLTSITGLGVNTTLQIIAEVGTDMRMFPSAKHFASYLGFTPHNKITGGAIISSKTDRIKSHAAQAFKKVVPSISRGKNALAAFYHRIAAKSGTGRAITAVCRKLAIIYYNTLVYGKDFVEKGMETYNHTQKQRQLKTLERLAKQHGMTLAPAV